MIPVRGPNGFIGIKMSPPKIGFLLNAMVRNFNKESSFVGRVLFFVPLENIGKLGYEPESALVFWIQYFVRFI